MNPNNRSAPNYGNNNYQRSGGHSNQPPPPPQHGGGYYPQQQYQGQGHPGQLYQQQQQQQQYYPREYAGDQYGYDDYGNPYGGYDASGYDYDDNYGEDDDEIDRAIAEMEAELENRGGSSQAGPADDGETLPPFANEIWFPECRDCSCCNGFKHGCACCSGRVKTCTRPDCSTGTAVAALATAAPAAAASTAKTASNVDKEFWFPEARDCTCCQGFKYKCACVSSKSLTCCADPLCQKGGPGAPSAEPARSLPDLADGELVVEAPSDTEGEAPAPAARRPGPAAAPGGAKMCHFFQQGNCRFGASCRFSHG